MDSEFNAYISQPFQLADGITVRLLGEVGNPRTQLVLVIEEQTNKTSIYNNFDLIKKSRTLLLEFQGSDLVYRGYKDVLNEYSFLNESGMGYGEIARFLNFHLLALLCKAYQEDQMGIEGGLGRFGLFTHLSAMGKVQSTDDFDAQLQEYFIDIKNGKLLWSLADSMFDRIMVRERLRNFRKQIEELQLFIPPDQINRNSLDIEKAHLFLGGWYDQARKLLKKGLPTEYDKYKKWINNLLEEIETMVNNSTNPLIQTLKEKEKRGGKKS